MKRTSWLKLLHISVLMLFVSGCVATHENVTDIAPDTLLSGQSIAVVYALDCAERTVFSGRCTKESGFEIGGTFEAYPTGVSKIAASVGKHDELRIATAKLNFKKVLQTSVTKHFIPQFESRGLKVIEAKEDIRAWTLPKKGKNSLIQLAAYYRDGTQKDKDRPITAISTNRNYQPVIESLNSDYLLVIEVFRYGLVRQYTPIISVAVEPPTGIAAIRATLHANNTAEPIYDNIVVRSRVPDFEWKVSPDFSALMGLPPLALDAVIQDAATDLFKL